MQVKVKKPKLMPVPTLDQQCKEIQQKYNGILQEQGKVSMGDVNPADVEILLDRYASDLQYDVYTLRTILHIGRTQLYKILHSERVLPLYESARNQRASLALQQGVNVLQENIDLAKVGESNRDLTNATKNLATYMLSYAQMLSKEFSMSNKENQGSVAINITLPEFNKGVIDCGDVKIDTGGSNGDTSGL